MSVEETKIISAELLNNFKKIIEADYTGKKEKNIIAEKINILKDYANDTEKQSFDAAINILDKYKFTVPDRNTLRELEKPLKKIAKRYEEEYNEQSNEDKINKIQTVDEIEAKLDDKINKYNIYKQTHPMKGVSYTKKKLWKCKIGDYEETNKKMNPIIISAKEKLLHKNTVLIDEKMDIKKYSFTHSNHYFVCYNHNNIIYFDIQHIISILNLKNNYSRTKYNDYSDQIKCYMWHENNYKGFILRELITRECMFNIILSSESKFSKSFKPHVSKMLDELANENKIIVTNEDFCLKKSQKKCHSNTDFENDKMINIKSYPIYNYDNPYHCIFINDLIEYGRNIPFTKFANEHILYACIIAINTGHKCIIIKFGYTNDIFKRVISLEKDYKSKIYFLKLKIIKGKPDEEKFHSLLKQKYPELMEPITINSKDKVELYKLSPILLKEFEYYKFDGNEDKFTDIINLEIDPCINIRRDKLINSSLIELKVMKSRRKLIKSEINLINLNTSNNSITNHNILSDKKNKPDLEPITSNSESTSCSGYESASNCCSECTSGVFSSSESELEHESESSAEPKNSSKSTSKIITKPNKISTRKYDPNNLRL